MQQLDTAVVMPPGSAPQQRLSGGLPGGGFLMIKPNCFTSKHAFYEGIFHPWGGWEAKPDGREHWERFLS